MQTPNPQPNRWPDSGAGTSAQQTKPAANASLTHVPLRVRQAAPQRLLFSEEEIEVEFYARSAFTAWEFALQRKRPHPKLWKAIRGSAYERAYLQRFGPQD